jgi:glycosyltransferase involved in cell wall biosynthesis
MRILMPIAQFMLGQGGAETQAHRLAAELIARGHEVEIISTRPAGTPKQALVGTVPVTRLFSFGNRRAIWRLGPYSYTTLLYRELVRRRGAHDVVHAHQAFHPAFAAVLARRRGGAPVLVKVATAGEFGDLRQMREGGPSFPIFSRRMLREIIGGADALVAISGAIADELAEEGAASERVVRIPNGVPVPPLPSQERRREARASLGLGDEPVALYVGRSGRQKGADLLAAAWPDVVAQLPRARLIMLGEGVTAPPPILTPGRVLDVPRYLEAADLFVLPSRGEGLSNAVLEAMAHGVPCLVSDLPANRDLVEPGVTGLVVASDNRQALARSLVDALQGVEQLAPLAARARRQVEERFAFDVVVAQYEALYQRLADQ